MLKNNLTKLVSHNLSHCRNVKALLIVHVQRNLLLRRTKCCIHDMTPEVRGLFRHEQKSDSKAIRGSDILIISIV